MTGTAKRATAAVFKGSWWGIGWSRDGSKIAASDRVESAGLPEC